MRKGADANSSAFAALSQGKMSKGVDTRSSAFEATFDEQSYAMEMLHAPSRLTAAWHWLVPTFTDEEAERISNHDPTSEHRTMRSQFDMILHRFCRMVGFESYVDVKEYPGRFAVRLFCITVCYSALFYGGIVFGERFAIDGVSAWYPAAGISLALCLWGGPIMFPLVFANEMMLCWVYVPVSFVSKTPYSLFLLGKALLYGAESAVLLCIDPSVQVNSPLKAVRFVIVVAVFHFTIGSFFFLMLFANNVSFDYGSGVASWLLGDATGVFAVTITFLEIRRAMIRIQGGTFALLTVTRFGKTFKWLYLLLRIAILVSLTTILLWLVFWPIPSDDVPRFYLVMLPLVVASLEFGVLGSALWFCVIAFSTLLTIFYSNDILPGSDIIDYQVALLIFALSSLFMGSEQERAREYTILSANARSRAEGLTLARNRMLEMVAHDIKTPLHGIQGMLEYLSKSSNLRPNDLKCVLTAQHSCFALSQIVGDVLAFRRLEAQGDFPIVSEFFSARDLTSLLDDIVDLFSTSSQEQQLGLHTSYPFELWAPTEQIFLGDLLRLRQVLTNLVSNALKFTLHGSIELRLLPVAAASAVVLVPQPLAITHREIFNIECRDSGRGMSREMIASLFNPYEQRDLDDERKSGGSGLGLYISNKIMRSMGGSLTASSKPGNGSTFRVRFPADKTTSAAASVPPLITESLCLCVLSADPTMCSFLSICALQCGASTTDNPSEAQVVILDLSSGIKSPGNISASRLLVIQDLSQSMPSKSLYENAGDMQVFVVFRPVHPSAVFQFLLEPDLLHPFLNANLTREGMQRSQSQAEAFVDEMLTRRRRSSMRDGSSSPSCGDELMRPPTNRQKRSSSIIVEPVFDRVHILVVDDVLINIKVATRLLGMLVPGATVHSCMNGFEAVDFFERETNLSIILCDLMMPISDGFEACASIRRLEKQLSRPRVPIIALTAAGDEVRDRVLSSGFDGYMAKPFNRNQLGKCLQKYGGKPFTGLGGSND